MLQIAKLARRIYRMLVKKLGFKNSLGLYGIRYANQGSYSLYGGDKLDGET